MNEAAPGVPGAAFFVRVSALADAHHDRQCLIMNALDRGALRRMVTGVASMVAVGMLLVAESCRRPSVAKRLVQGVPSGAFSELTENALSVLLVCHDSLGIRTTDGTYGGRAGRCRPCIPYGVLGEGRGALRHARALWDQAGRAPHDTGYLAAGCTTLAFETAHRVSPEAFTVDIMGNFPPGRHVVEVRIDDLVAGTSVSRSVSVRVLARDAQRRAPLTREQPFPAR